MKGEHKILLASVALGLMGTGVFVYLRGATAQVVPVVVAARNLEAREVLKQEDLTIKLVPPAARDGRSLQDAAQLLGKALVTPVFEGEQIRPGRVAVDDLALAADEVSLALPTDLVSAVGGMLKRGDVVDIYVTFSPEKTRRADVLKVGEGVRILSVRDSGARTRDNGDKDAVGDPTRATQPAGNPAVVIIKVPSGSVAALKQAAAFGTLAFTRRSPDASVPEKAIILPLPPVELVVTAPPQFAGQSVQGAGQVVPMKPNVPASVPSAPTSVPTTPKGASNP